MAKVNSKKGGAKPTVAKAEVPKNDEEMMAQPVADKIENKDNKQKAQEKKQKPAKKAKKQQRQPAPAKKEVAKEPKVTEPADDSRKNLKPGSPYVPGLENYHSETDDDYDPAKDEAENNHDNSIDYCSVKKDACGCGCKCGCKDCCCNKCCVEEEEEEEEEYEEDGVMTMSDTFTLSPSKPEFVLRLVPNQQMKIARISLGKDNESSNKHIIEMFFHYDPITNTYEDSCTIERLIPGVIESATSNVEISYVAQCIKFVLRAPPKVPINNLGDVEFFVQYTIPKSDVNTFFNFPGGEEEEEEEEEELMEEDEMEELAGQEINEEELKDIKQKVMKELSKQGLKPGQPLKRRANDAGLEEMKATKKAPADKPVRREGIEYRIQTEGKGVQSKKGDSVRVTYITKSIGPNGASKIIEKTPAGKYFDLKLGGDDVPKFLSNGIAGMKVGEKRQITVPVRALKNEKSPNFPVDNPLDIMVTLVSINPKAK